jgi:hypothetical protein
LFIFTFNYHLFRVARIAGVLVSARSAVSCLSRRPEFADRCDWLKLKPLAWRQLLMRQPQFVDKCDKWEEIRPFGGAYGASTKAVVAANR